MNAKLYVGNLSEATTQSELNALFAQVGNVSEVEVIRKHQSDESSVFAFITMSEQSDAEKAISLFNTYSLNGHELKVCQAIVK